VEIPRITIFKGMNAKNNTNILYFPPQQGIKPILPVFAFLTVILIPTFLILIFTDATWKDGLIILGFAYLLTGLAYFLAQKVTRYWIEGDTFNYKALFKKEGIDIQSIRKLEVNASNWQASNPSTSNTKGIIIYFKKYEDVFITPSDNMLLVDELRKRNPDIEVVFIK